MKTLRIYFLLIIFGILSIPSCNQEEHRLQPEDDLNDQIGYWHNTAVTSVFNNRDFMNAVNSGSISYTEIRVMIMKELSNKDPQLFNFVAMRTNLAWSDQILAEKGIIPGPLSGNVRKQESESLNLGAIFQYLYEINEIGEILYNSFTELNKKVMFAEVSRDEIIKLSKQIRDLPLSDREKSYVDVFNQVLYASNNYWENTHARVQDKKALGIIWADAAGGLYGMLCGPICSIIEAAAFSTIVAIQ
jgi:hypothetical protein